MYYKFRQELIDGMQYRYREPSLDERISFYFAFDISPDEQIALEQYYDGKPDPTHSPPKFVNSLALESVQYYAEPEQKTSYAQC